MDRFPTAAARACPQRLVAKQPVELFGQFAGARSGVTSRPPPVAASSSGKAPWSGWTTGTPAASASSTYSPFGSRIGGRHRQDVELGQEFDLPELGPPRRIAEAALQTRLIEFAELAVRVRRCCGPNQPAIASSVDSMPSAEGQERIHQQVQTLFRRQTSQVSDRGGRARRGEAMAPASDRIP